MDPRHDGPEQHREHEPSRPGEPRRDPLSPPAAQTPPSTGASPVSDPGTLESRRSIASLLSELLRELQRLVRSEGRLARTEVGEKIRQASSGAGAVGAGGMTAFAGLLFLLLSATLGLNLWIEAAWLSALIVGGVVLLIGLAILAKGRSNLKAENLKPERTAASLRRDAELGRHEMGRVR